jgi:predicted phosphodiesterase
MNILVFSDTHLYLPFEQKKFDYLKKIIEPADQVIINGDFFDGYMIRFEDFVKSEWNKLFPLLKSKKAIYIYGNHDQKILSDQRVNLFSVKQTEQFKLKINNKIFIFEHGQQLRKTLDLLFKDIRKIMLIVHLIVRLAHFQARTLTNMFGRKYLEFRFSRRNNLVRKKIKNKIPENNFLIIGHNHWAEVDEKNRFACSGINLYDFAQYLTIDSTAKITLHERWYDR